MRKTTAVAASLALGGLVLWLTPFNVIIVALYAIGTLMSALFCFTWFPLAFRARAHRRQDVSIIRIIDYAGLPAIVMLAYVLILRTIIVYGITPPPDNIAVVSRLLLPLMLDLIIGLRLFKWGRQLWRNRRVNGEEELISGVARDPRPADQH